MSSCTDAMSFSDLGIAGGMMQQLKTRTNPLDAFNDVFPPGSGVGTDPARPNRDGLLVARVYQDYLRLKQNRRLSAADKQLVDQYVNLVAELQAKLKPQPTLSCTRPLAPAALANNSGTDPGDIKTKWDLFLDVVTAAVMCDRTHVITIGVHKALGPGPDPSNPTLTGHYHSEDASGGTWHSVPCLLAGSAGGFIKPGRYLDYIDWSDRAYFAQENGNVIKGIPHNQFLVTVLQAMGLAPADYERDGQPGYGSLSTSGRPANLWPVDYDMSKAGQILPGIQG